MLSIIVPVFNVEGYLQKCVESILGQDYRDFELLLIDDGSTDHSGTICDKYSLVDSRVKVIHKKNGGLSDARNFGINEASGDLLSFIDSDDFINGKMMEILVRNLYETDSDISECFFKKYHEGDILSENISNMERTVIEKNDIMEQLYTSENNVATIVAWNKVYKRKLFDGIFFPIGKYHEDQAIIHRVLHKCKRLVYTKNELYYYLQRDGSIMSMNIDKRISDLYFALADRINFLEQNGYGKESIQSYHALLNQLLSAVYYEHYDRPYGYHENITYITSFIKKAMDEFERYKKWEDQSEVNCEMLLNNENFFWIYRWCKINIFSRVSKIINHVRH